MIVRYRTRPRVTRASSIRPAGTPDAAGAFLSAEVGVQKNGMALSVMSMLSRQDIDPWDEVRHLSRLSRGEAVARLTMMILNARVELSGMGGASALASDLVRLLPDSRAAALDPANGHPRAITWSRRPEGSRGPAAARDEVRPSARMIHTVRLLILLIACAILIVIGIVDPRSIVSSGESRGSITADAGPTPGASVPPHP
jgi:hypothetical protein